MSTHHSDPGRSRRGLLLVVVTFALVGLAGYGYLQSAAPEPPSIEVVPALYEFGEIGPTDVLTREFAVRNDGGRRLEITRISTSCGCTTAEIEAKTIEPGGTTTLRVTFDPQAMGADLSGSDIVRMVYVQSNDPDDPEVEVELRGRVRADEETS